MRPATTTLLLLLAVAAARPPPITGPDDAHNATVVLDDLNGTVYVDSRNHTLFVDNNNRTINLDDLLHGNDTAVEYDGDHEPIVRKKRTFGDIVFRGLADVLGYNVARKQPQVVFPPPLAPVPGIDAPLYVIPAVALSTDTQAGPAAPPAAAPCAAGRATPAPCRAAKPAPPPAPRAAPPCPRPRAAPRPKPKPKPTPAPPPPPPPPCPQPRANPTTPSPCSPAKPPAAKQQADPNLETISSNFQLNFNFNRGPATQATSVANDDQQEQQQEQDELEQTAPIAIAPQAARLPPEVPRKPRVFVDAFVVRNGVPERVDTVDAKQLDLQSANDDDDLLGYDEYDMLQAPDDYEDAQETQNQDKTIKEFGNVIDRFWEKKKTMQRTQKMKSPNFPKNHYHNVHFGDRDLNEEIRHRGGTHQNLQREQPSPNRIPVPIPEDDDVEATTTTEDPQKPLRPRVLPPTEHHPNQIDTITVRVPPIYKEKRPRKLHRDRYEPERDEEDYETINSRGSSREDTDGDDTTYYTVTERPIRRKRRRKHSRKTRSTAEQAEYKTDDEFDYFGEKVPVSDHEKYFMELTVPPPTRDSDVLRHEKPVASGYFLEDHERLRDDPSQRLKDDPSQRLKDDPPERFRDNSSQKLKDGRIQEEKERVDSSERIDERERADDKERTKLDFERGGDDERADEKELSDRLSPNARVTESAYENKYVRATNVQVDDPRPRPAARKNTGTTGRA